jgi:hypothetical protein
MKYQYENSLSSSDIHIQVNRAVCVHITYT